MEARIARLESTTEHIQADVSDLKVGVRDLRSDIRDLRRETQTDFRVIFGAIVTVALWTRMDHG